MTQPLTSPIKIPRKYWQLTFQEVRDIRENTRPLNFHRRAKWDTRLTIRELANKYRASPESIKAIQALPRLPTPEERGGAMTTQGKPSIATGYRNQERYMLIDTLLHILRREMLDWQYSQLYKCSKSTIHRIWDTLTPEMVVNRRASDPLWKRPPGWRAWLAERESKFGGAPWKRKLSESD